MLVNEDIWRIETLENYRKLFLPSKFFLCSTARFGKLMDLLEFQKCSCSFLALNQLLVPTQAVQNAPEAGFEGFPERFEESFPALQVQY